MLDRIVKTCGIPVKEWGGQCYIIAMTLLACEEGSGELATGFYYTDDDIISDHGWVEYPDGTIADPTRWTLDNTKPNIYRGVAVSNYDKDGVRWEKDLAEINKPLVKAALSAAKFRAACLAAFTLGDLKNA
ncbi:hypothetical protein LCGC14_1191460 [marine sediment metagenome]|uniref:Transglutaminase-like domain-containing protein n=1 Tax=marine sediment metagenome TaxID=412755 RepID=A0A0F9LNZ1_9ZZZZ